MAEFAVEWEFPNSGLLATVLELDNFNTSPYLTSLQASYNDVLDPDIQFEVISGEFPEGLIIDNDLDVIRGIVNEMDTYVSGWVQPPDFTYDSQTKSGGLYGTYGSALAGSKTFTFTIRAFKEDLRDSNGDLPDNAYDDRIFHILVRNNYSSDRDSFVTEYFKQEFLEKNGLLLDSNGEQITPEEWILLQKSRGYYL